MPTSTRRLAGITLAVSLTMLSTLPLAGGAAALPPGLGGAGSSASGADGGSVSAGSVVPAGLRDDPPPLPVLRDDIAAPAIVGEEVLSGRLVRFTVASPALRREVGVEVILPKDNSVPRPALYALDGVDAGESTSGWVTKGGAPEFFADKNVNVVMVNGGASGMYTDWESVDPSIGLHRWETFLTEELPALMDARLDTDGVRSLLGISMGAQGAMTLAHRHPGMYRGVAAFSGCYSTTDDLGRISVQSTVSSRSADPANLWGAVGGPGWVAHDTLRNAEALRGTDLYLSVGNGLPGPHEAAATPDVVGRVLIGGPLEIVTNGCTQRLDARLRQLGIPATVDYEPHGVHAWAYWRERLPKAWPTLARSLGLPA